MLLDDSLWERTFAEERLDVDDTVVRRRTVPFYARRRTPHVRLLTKDCIFNVNMYNRVFSQHAPIYSMCAPSLSLVRSIASKRLSIDFSNLKP